MADKAYYLMLTDAGFTVHLFTTDDRSRPMCTEDFSDVRMSCHGIVPGMPESANACPACAIPDDAVYVRYNEFGGVTRSHTMADIRRLTGTNGWRCDYDAERDEFFAFRLNDRGTGHTLTRYKR